MKTDYQQYIIMAIGLIFLAIVFSFRANAQQVPVKLAVLTSHQGSFCIDSPEEFVLAENAIHRLAEELYSYHQRYPRLQYRLVYDESGALSTVDVEGICDVNMSTRVAHCVLQLEIMGAAIRNVEVSNVPKIEDEKWGRLTRRQARSFKPFVNDNPGDAAASSVIVSSLN